MRYMLMRKTPDAEIAAAEVSEGSAPLSEVRFSTALSVNGKWIPVTLEPAPPRAPHAGTCTCEACLAAWLADPGIRFF